MYKKGPDQNLMMDEGGNQKPRKRESIVCRHWRIGGGTTFKIASSYLFFLTNASSSLSTMRGE
jgi:hypothetical protein